MPTELSGVRVVCLESRRSREMAALVEKRGGMAIAAPSMKQVPLDEQRDALRFAEVLERGECDVLILLTGAGARLLLDALLTRLDREHLLAKLRGLSVYCRGPKPHAVWRELGLTPSGVAAEPNTSRELLALLTREPGLAGRRVFVQEYGTSSPELLDSLSRLGAVVTPIGVYAWTLPDDLAPLEQAVDALCRRAADAVVFTSAQQLEHLVAVATRQGRLDELLSSLREHVVVASIGPVTSEALARHGVNADLVASHPKMGQLVSDLARHWPTLATKCASAASR